jgi:tetratricopeptide (TPR) repeat protein
MTLHRLKVAALQHEQREDWPAAIELYRQAIREAEGNAEGGDPSLYNRVGDLSHKAGNATAACEAWEQAVARYADLGFLNSAIALCGKILRVSPARVQTYLELARLQARKRVLYDVRLNLRTYLDQMSATGHAAAGRAATERLSEEFPGWRELDALLDELLGRERPAELSTAAAGPDGTEATGLVFLDTAPLTIERASESIDTPPDADRPAASVVEGIEIETGGAGDAVSGFEPTHPHHDQHAPTSHDVDGLVGVEQASQDAGDVTPMAGIDHSIPVQPPESAIAPHAGLDVVDGAMADRAGGEAQRTADVEDTDAAIGGDLVFLETTPVADDDALGERVNAHALLDHGDRAAGIEKLEHSLATYQDQGEWLHAYQVATELIAAEPQAIGRYQARVELASRLRDQPRLCEAYVALGDALVREGSEEKAIAVYRRVLQLDDNEPRARAALRAMAPESTAPPTPAGFIDLGAMLIDDHPRSTRMRTEMPDVAADENDTFRDALAEFKRALDQNVSAEDHQAHYDLGIAFKEMGLLDEAVGEFQKALRAPEVRLRTSEALGEVFFDQGRPAVAEAVLRGVENSSEGDAEKIGVLYWLGRALDAQARHDEAVRYYQRVIAVDVNFRDASQRLTAPGTDPS